MGASESVAHRSGGRGGAERGAEPPAGEMGGAGCRCGAAGHGPGGVHEVLDDARACFSRINRSKALGQRDCAAGPSQGKCSGAFEQRLDRSAELRPELDLAGNRPLREFPACKTGRRRVTLTGAG